MKKLLQGFITGIISGVVIADSIVVFAAYYTAVDNPFPVTYNGNSVSMEGYNIDGSTYFKLRDIADVVGGFNVGFENNRITLTDQANHTETINSNNDNSINNTAGSKSSIQYDTSFKLDKYYSTGRWWKTTDIESFKITNTELSYSGELIISYEMVGVVTGSDTCSINLICYDKGGFVIDNGLIFESVADGQKFKIKDTLNVSPETVKLEFTDN